MRTSKTCSSELLELAVDQYHRHQIDRRTLLKALGVFGLTATFYRSGPVFGQVKELVMVNWGGPAIEAYHDAFAPLFEKETGLDLVIDGTGPTAGKVRAMVDAGNVTWDVLDAGVGTALLLGNEGYLEEIDFDIVDKTQVRPEFVWKWGVCGLFFSYVLTYDAKKFGDNPPKNWQDFWNVKDFPGKRLLRNNPIGQLECAVMAAGIPKDKVYPIDMELALEKIRELKEHTVYWGSGSQSQQYFFQGEVSMGNIWHNRSNLLRRDTNGAINWTWQDGIVSVDLWSVVKNNPAGKTAAMQFINSAISDLEGQVALFEVMSSGPANPKAAEMIPEELRPYNPAQPENYAMQVPFDGEWWQENEIEAFERYGDVIAS